MVSMDTGVDTSRSQAATMERSCGLTPCPSILQDRTRRVVVEHPKVVVGAGLASTAAPD
jgi:hypothetical protein